MSAVVSHESAALPEARLFQVTDYGLKIEPGTSYDEWAEETGNFLHLANMTPLYVADALIYAMDRWGEAKAFAIIPDIGKTKHTVQNWISVARAFPLTRRVAGLEMGHYDALAGIKDKDKKPLIAKQDDLAKRAAAEGWKVARTRQEAADARDRAQGKLIDVPDDREEDAPDTPIMDTGAFGEGLSAERGEGSRPETDGFEDIERMRKVWAKMTPDLHIRFLRSVMTADLFMQVAPDFQQSSSHVEHTAPTAAPCEAPAVQTPAVSIPVSDPAGGGSHSEDPLEIPGFLKRSTEAV